ncbi:MAG TPA: O-antigen polymerase [Chitinophagaceae bacterium]
MNRINLYSVIIRVHILLLAITAIGSLAVIAAGHTDWLIPFLTIPLINLLLIPLTHKDEKFDPTHPLLLILVSLMIGTVLRSFFILSPFESDAKPLMLMGKSPTILLKGLGCIYLGLSCFIFGYTLTTKSLPDWSNRKIFRSQVSLKKFIPLAILLTGVSLVSAAFYFKKMGVNFYAINELSQKRHYKVDDGSYSSLGYYRLCMDLIEPVFYILLIYFIQKRKRIVSLLGIFILILGVLNMAYPFIESSRSNALYVLINTGLIIYYLKGGIKWRQLTTVVAIASFALIVMTELRESHSKINSQTEVSSNPLAIMVGTLNFLGIDKTSQIIDEMPNKMDYQFGETLVLWLVAPIPRTMWPKKPDITEGREIGELIYEKRDENSPGGGVPPGFIAEMYLNFGYFGVIAGTFIAGLILKLFYTAFKKVRQKSVYGMVVYILVFVPFALKLMGSDFSGCIVKLFYYTLPVYVIMKLIQKSPEYNS